ACPALPARARAATIDPFGYIATIASEPLLLGQIAGAAHQPGHVAQAGGAAVRRRERDRDRVVFDRRLDADPREADARATLASTTPCAVAALAALASAARDSATKGPCATVAAQLAIATRAARAARARA